MLLLRGARKLRYLSQFLAEYGDSFVTPPCGTTSPSVSGAFGVQQQNRLLIIVIETLHSILVEMKPAAHRQH